VGGLFSYGVTNYSTDNISGDSHDWRLGAYVDHKNGNWDYQGLVSYGRNKYDLDRSINLAGSGLGNSTLNSDYQAKVWDVEAKAKYLIPSTKDKTWQLTPYGKLSYTHTNQDAYSETAGGSSMASSGGSVFAQNIESASNNSTRGEIGLEFKRSYDKHGGWGGSVGYKRVISGVNPELNGTFAGDTLSGNGFTIQSDNDKNFVTYSLNVHGSLGGRWTGQAELRGEASQNTHKEIISVAAKYSF
jgi:outer membrane autotransporter protein